MDPEGDGNAALADEAASAGWDLFRQTPKDEALGLDVSFVRIRPISEEELRALDRAEGTYRRFSTDWGHLAVLESVQHLGATSVEALLAAERASQEISAIDAGRVHAAVEGFGRAARERVEAISADGSDLVRAELVALLDDPATTSLVDWLAGGDFQVLGAEVGGDRRVVLQRPNTQEVVDLHGVVARVVTALERLADAELVDAQDALLRAGSVMMSYVAEVVWGVPVLVPAGAFASTPLKLDLRQIQLGQIRPVMSAVAVADSRRRRPGQQPSARSETAATADGESDRRRSGMGEPPSEAAPADDSSVGVEASAGAGGDCDQGGDSTVGSAALDRDALALIVSEALRLSPDIEQRWAEALEGSIGHDYREVRDRLATMIAILKKAVDQEQADAAAAGVDTRIPRFPLDARSANRIELDPDAPTMVLQRGLAELYSLTNLLGGLHDLGHPTASVVSLPGGEVRSWWELSAVGAAASAARLAARVLSPTAASSPARSRDESAANAHRAWMAGLPEAAVLYLVAAVDPGAVRPGRERAHDSLLSLASRLARGDEVSLDIVVPLTRYWLDELSHVQSERFVGDRGTP